MVAAAVAAAKVSMTAAAVAALRVSAEEAAAEIAGACLRVRGESAGPSIFRDRTQAAGMAMPSEPSVSPMTRDARRTYRRRLIAVSFFFSPKVRTCAWMDYSSGRGNKTLAARDTPFLERGIRRVRGRPPDRYLPAGVSHWR
jgi:hypothetical protein